MKVRVYATDYCPDGLRFVTVCRDKTVRQLQTFGGDGPSADLLARVVSTRWLCGDKNGAVRDCQRLISTDVSYADAAKSPKIAAMSDEDDKAVLLAAIAETLRRHPALAPKPGK